MYLSIAIIMNNHINVIEWLNELEAHYLNPSRTFQNTYSWILDLLVCVGVYKFIFISSKNLHVIINFLYELM